MQSNRLLKAKVWHLREKPKRNEFTYSVYYLAHRVGSDLAKTPRLLSFDRFNVLSLYKKDLGKKDGSEWLPWIQDQFRSHGVAVSESDSVEVISHPRLFGYAFNPITFWLLLNEHEEIKAVLCEVHNTFGDTHNYVLAHPDGRAIAPEDVFTAAKNLYVSPFNTMDGYYTFTFARTADSFKTDIIYYVGEEAVVKTAMQGRYSRLSSLSILGVVFAYPLMTVMVVARIHWQAIKLWWKGVPHQLKKYPGEVPDGTTKGVKQDLEK